jgi:hypothetical protein
MAASERSVTAEAAAATTATATATTAATAATTAPAAAPKAQARARAAPQHRGCLKPETEKFKTKSIQQQVSSARYRSVCPPLPLRNVLAGVVLGYVPPPTLRHQRFAVHSFIQCSCALAHSNMMLLSVHAGSIYEYYTTTRSTETEMRPSLRSSMRSSTTSTTSLWYSKKIKLCVKGYSTGTSATSQSCCCAMMYDCVNVARY